MPASTRLKSLVARSLLMRSIAFSFVAKGVGALMVVVGLPLIAITLDLGDYREFLRSMSIVSIVSLVFGPIAMATIIDFGRFKGDLETRDVLTSSLKPYIRLGGLLAMLLLLAVTSGEFTELLTPFMLLAILITIAQNVLSWAESWRLARRTDYVSSLFQVVSTLMLVGCLLIVPTRQLIVIGGLYYGVPLVISFISFLEILWRTQWKPSQGTFHRSLAFDITRNWPLLFLSVIDYGRIYGCGLLIERSGSAADYAKYFTIILFIARLVNPISLITKPLLPAYLDAEQRGDSAWLRRANVLVSAGGLTALVMPVLFAVALPQSWSLSILPQAWGTLERFDVGVTGVYFAAYLCASVLSPLYIALGRTHEYVIVGLVSVGGAIMVTFVLHTTLGAGDVMTIMAGATMLASIWYMLRLAGPSVAAAPATSPSNNEH